ncbi:MAG: hypothetical protein M3Z25_13540 [Actinomycetota bacterium]|nr:hypothetical protein [Actinomycetota bacterium]
MALEIPSCCTLPSAQRPVRLAEFEVLFAHAVSAQHLNAQHLRVSFADTTEATVRDLAARESSCCSFFEFTVTSADDRVLFDVDVPAPRCEVLDGLATLVRGDTL